MEKDFRAGFATIIGVPNVGKSTLLNALMDVDLSISTPKAHTTRENVLGIHSSPSSQIVFCDTPGMLNEAYALQRHMSAQLQKALRGSDVVIFLLSAHEQVSDLHHRYLSIAQKSSLLPVLNKIDTCSAEDVKSQLNKWRDFFGGEEVLPISALKRTGTAYLLQKLGKEMPLHPAYYPCDQLTDKSERFIAAEILRKHILLGYKSEVPYSTYVSVSWFQKVRNVLHIHAIIYTERPSQKAILIGEGGRSLRGTGCRARQEMQRFFGEHIYLRTQVEVAKKWKHRAEEVQRMLHR